MKVVAIIPAYNEEKTIREVVTKVKNYVDEVIVIDDGSTDRTYQEAQESGAMVLSHLINRGQGAAIQTGIFYALKNNADVLVTFDADGQFVPEEIPIVIKPILEKKVDVVLGSRFLKLNQIPTLKKVFLRGAIIFTRFTSGLSLSDTHNGFRAFSRDAAEKILISQDRMAHASEILNKIAALKLSYLEVPVTLKYLPYHRQKTQGFFDYCKILFDLFLGRMIKS
jgi:glycosyltransferase involved in cell wall biosynthesis